MSYEIQGQDESRSCEIFLTYRVYGSVTETIKCGTGDDIQDGIMIADYIRDFIETGK